ncbi:MAG: hypothetical protein AAF682_29980 [Planctomycetota bacterium]
MTRFPDVDPETARDDGPEAPPPLAPPPLAPPPAAPPATEPPAEPRSLSWNQPEVAWLIGSALGFAAAWAGGVSGLPWAGALVAAALAVALQFLLLRRGRDGTAAMVALSTALGAALAGVGLVLEQSYLSAAPAFPLAEAFVEREIRPLLAGDTDLILAATGRNALVALVLLVLARPTQGLAPLVGGAVAGGALGVAGGWCATAGADTPPEVLDGVLGVAPWGLLQLAGVLLAQAALAGPERLFPLDEMAPARRRVLFLGLVLLALGLAAQPLVAAPWGAWVARLPG